MWASVTRCGCRRRYRCLNISVRQISIWYKKRVLVLKPGFGIGSIVHGSLARPFANAVFLLCRLLYSIPRSRSPCTRLSLLVLVLVLFVFVFIFFMLPIPSHGPCCGCMYNFRLALLRSDVPKAWFAKCDFAIGFDPSSACISERVNTMTCPRINDYVVCTVSASSIVLAKPISLLNEKTFGISAGQEDQLSIQWCGTYTKSPKRHAV